MSDPQDDLRVSRWLAAFAETQKTLAAWVFMMAVLAVSRIVYLVALRSYWPADYSIEDLLKVIGCGTRFDCVTVTCLCTVPLALNGVAILAASAARWAHYARRLTVACFVFAAPVLLLGSISYYQEYRDYFNTWIFELFFDDATMILGIMQSEYWLAQKMALSAATAFALWKLYCNHFERQWLPEQASLNLVRGKGRFAMPVAGVLAFVAGTRCSFEGRPLQHVDAGVTADRFFNKATFNGFYAVNAAAFDRLQELRSQVLYPPLEDSQVAEAAEHVFYENVVHGTTEPETAIERALDDPLLRIAAGPKTPHPPRQIFLIIMESYDAWPFLDRYRSLGLVENGRRFAEQGLHVKAFLPAGSHSLNSFLALANGLHHTNRFAQRQHATALPSIFSRLGYKPRLFAGDSATWQHMEELSASEGFREFYAAGSISKSQYVKPRVHDEELFDFVASHVSRDECSINVIRTTSNHGPYEVDLQKEGCLIKKLPADLAGSCNKDQTILLNHLGHLKYSDKCLGRFIDRLEATLPDALFVITGDHYGRNFVNTQPTDFEANCVPLILYGKRAIAGLKLPENVAGSHLDITPTLAALAAPAGFRFASLGVDLLAERPEFLGLSETHAVGPEFIVNLEGVPTVEGLPWTDNDSAGLRQAQRNLPRITRNFNALQGLSTWLDRQPREASLREFAPATRR